MSTPSIVKVLGLAGALALGAAVQPTPAFAHCDSLDGPVVRAAVEALETGRVERVLAWVRPADEAEIRQAFQRTVEVRRLGGPAAALADRWFFETVVRVHRQGEGAPFTGLKPAGAALDPGIAAAEKALAEGTVAEVAPRLAAHLTEAVTERFREVQARADFAPDDVEAGRAYVEAYVAWIHFVEDLVAVVHGAAGAHPGA